VIFVVRIRGHDGHEPNAVDPEVLEIIQFCC
jgi:hypothetical protein